MVGVTDRNAGTTDDKIGAAHSLLESTLECIRVIGNVAEVDDVDIQALQHRG